MEGRTSGQQEDFFLIAARMKARASCVLSKHTLHSLPRSIGHLSIEEVLLAASQIVVFSAPRPLTLQQSGKDRLCCSNKQPQMFQTIKVWFSQML